VASSIVSPQKKPTSGARSRYGSSASRTASSVHIPSAEPCPAAWNTSRSRGGSSAAITPPWTTNTSPLSRSAAGLARYTTSGVTCSGAIGSGPSSGGGLIIAAVIAVRARGQMALARTP
jgi:hypothetical protein